MPLYEYKCTKCGSILEVLQNISDKPLKKCLKCGSPMKKVLSPPALQFKGSGWYITDYAQNKKPKKKEKDKEKSKSKKWDDAKKSVSSSKAKKT